MSDREPRLPAPDLLWTDVCGNAIVNYLLLSPQIKMELRAALSSARVGNLQRKNDFDC
jgi:hypothetical protein